MIMNNGVSCRVVSCRVVSCRVVSGLYVLNDYSGLSSNPRVGHACHLGGAGVGIAAAVGLRFPPTRRMIRRML